MFLVESEHNVQILIGQGGLKAAIFNVWSGGLISTIGLLMYYVQGVFIPNIALLRKIMYKGVPSLVNQT